VKPDPNNHSTGGFATKQNGERIWFIFNYFHDLDQGGHFSDSNQSGLGRFSKYYVLGNIFANIGQVSTLTNQQGDGAAYPSGLSAFSVGEGPSAGNSAIGLVNNTYWNCRHGLGYGAPSGPTIFMYGNNIIHLSHATHHMVAEQSGGPANARNNLLDPSVGSTRVVNWRNNGTSTVLSVAQFQSQFPSDGSGNLAAAHGMINPAIGDFHLSTGSAARGAGLNDPGGFYALFQTTYGLNIKQDFDGRPLPASGAWDVGALQFATPGGPPATPMNLRTF
jgi:hypothetical protein